MTRTAQWCGSGRPCGPDTVWDVITGNDNVGDRGVTEETRPATSSRRSISAGSRRSRGGPWAIYGQAVAEDEAGGFPSRYFGQFGAETWGRLDTRLFSGQWRAHLEYTNTLVHFWPASRTTTRPTSTASTATVTATAAARSARRPTATAS
jgi:hypothetical protein